MIGDIDLDVAKATAERIGSDTLALPLDVTSTESVADFMDTVESTLGPIDVYVNNAGVMPLSALLDEDDATIDRIFAINTRAMIHGTREAARRMLPATAATSSTSRPRRARPASRAARPTARRRPRSSSTPRGRTPSCTRAGSTSRS